LVYPWDQSGHNPISVAKALGFPVGILSSFWKMPTALHTVGYDSYTIGTVTEKSNVEHFTGVRGNQYLKIYVYRTFSEVVRHRIKIPHVMNMHPTG
jgi:hypothetical protein